MKKTPHPCKYDWEPIPPGETLVELLEYHGFSQRDLAERTGYSAKHINQVILGNAPIKPEFALLLERVLGTSAETWNRLEANYQTRQQTWKAQQWLSQEKDLLQHPVIKELQKRGDVVKGDTAAAVESVLRFYGVGTVEALHKTAQTFHAALRHSPSFKSDPFSLGAWFRFAERQAVGMRCRSYDAPEFHKALHAVRALTRKNPQEFVPAMKQICADAGVAVVFVPEFKGVRAYGATKWLAPDKAMIALNLRGKTNDVFWFTFFHEAAHILYDSKKSPIIESDTGGKQTKSEQKADRFAAKFLIPDDMILPSLETAEGICRYASEIGIAPGIVVGRMQHDKIIRFNQFNKLKERFVWGETKPTP